MSNLIVLSGLPIRQSKRSLSVKFAYDSGSLEVDLDTASVYKVQSNFGLLMNTVTAKGGYLCVSVHTGLFGSVSCPVHMIVAYALWGDSALVEGVHIDHINGDVQNNKPSNLQLLTHRDNISKGWYAKQGNDQILYTPYVVLKAS